MILEIAAGADEGVPELSVARHGGRGGQSLHQRDESLRIAKRVFGMDPLQNHGAGNGFKQQNEGRYNQQGLTHPPFREAQADAEGEDGNRKDDHKPRRPGPEEDEKAENDACAGNCEDGGKSRDGATALL